MNQLRLSYFFTVPIYYRSFLKMAKKKEVEKNTGRKKSKNSKKSKVEKLMKIAKEKKKKTSKKKAMKKAKK